MVFSIVLLNLSCDSFKVSNDLAVISASLLAPIKDVTSSVIATTKRPIPVAIKAALIAIPNVLKPTFATFVPVVNNFKFLFNFLIMFALPRYNWLPVFTTKLNAL